MKIKMLVVMVLLIVVAASGCSDDSTIHEAEGGQDVEVTSSGEDDWCPVGTSWQSSNPATGEQVSMEVTGKEVIDGVEMCKAEFNSNDPGEEIARIEYMWSEDGEIFSWKSFDASGKLVSEMSMKDGTMTIVDEEGTVNTITTNQ
ncbi:membrane-binding protein [Methanolobus halotolerans]|uniref:Membrane-binding protein n=1 Tax=Methanolobus halotolerans TaxID=2052935 RepID=A0A4E0Q783_9EURY|nr:membrane-binding protein [Methanolobus halotolerans]TGC06663.1 membrane-binding protein [Methanolobus halotolerans]